MARGRASELELWQIEALLPEMEASAKESCFFRTAENSAAVGGLGDPSRWGVEGSGV